MDGKLIINKCNVHIAHGEIFRSENYISLVRWGCRAEVEQNDDKIC